MPVTCIPTHKHAHRHTYVTGKYFCNLASEHFTKIESELKLGALYESLIMYCKSDDYMLVLFQLGRSCCIRHRFFSRSRRKKIFWMKIMEFRMSSSATKERLALTVCSRMAFCFTILIVFIFNYIYLLSKTLVCLLAIGL